MGLLIKFFCAVLVIGLAGLFVIKKPDGTPWLSLEDLKPDTPSVAELIPKQIIGGSNENVPVFKWKDSEGNWQFSDKAPENIEAQQVLISTNVNRDLAPIKPKSIPTQGNSAKNGKALLIKDSGLSPTTISPGNAATLINDAKNVQNLVDERQKQLESALNNH